MPKSTFKLTHVPYLDTDILPINITDKNWQTASVWHLPYHTVTITNNDSSLRVESYYEYDDDGDVIEKIFCGSRTIYTYETVNSVKRLKKEELYAPHATEISDIVVYQYDDDNLLISTHSRLSGTTTYGYNDKGECVSIAEDCGMCYRYKYNDSGLCIAFRQIYDNQLTATCEYNYKEVNGSMKPSYSQCIKYEGGETTEITAVDYIYSGSRIVTIQEYIWKGTEMSPTCVTDITYDYAGEPIVLTTRDMVYDEVEVEYREYINIPNIDPSK